jgi:hypothetical protein
LVPEIATLFKSFFERKKWRFDVSASFKALCKP